MKRQIFGVVATCALAISLSACASTEPQQAETDYADDEAMGIIAEGWIDRAEILEGSEELQGTEADEQLKQAVQAEIDAGSSLKGRQFENTKMQEDVLAYLNSLDAQMDVLTNYSSSSIEYYEKWTEAYNNRTAIIKKLADEYGLAVDGKYKADFDKIITDGTNAVENKSKEDAIEGLISGATWEAIDDGYGSITYTAVIENTTDYDFKNVLLIVGMYDADGVRTESYANANSWKAGDKVKFEAYSTEGLVERVEATIDFFEAD